MKELESSMKITFINKYFDLKTLANLGFIEKNLNINELEDRICNFFQLDNIFEYEKRIK